MSIRLEVVKSNGYIEAVVDEYNNKIYKADDGDKLASWHDRSVYNLNAPSTNFIKAAVLLVRHEDAATNYPYFDFTNSDFTRVLTTDRHDDTPIYISFMSMTDSTMNGETLHHETRLPIIKIERSYQNSSTERLNRITFHQIDADGNITRVAQGNLERFRMHTLDFEMSVDKYLETLGKFGINILSLVHPFFTQGGTMHLDDNNCFDPQSGTYKSSIVGRHVDVAAITSNGTWFSFDIEFMNNQKSKDYANILTAWSSSVIDDNGNTIKRTIPRPIQMQANKEYVFTTRDYFNHNFDDDPTLVSEFTLFSNSGSATLTVNDSTRYTILTAAAPDQMILCWKRIDSNGITYRRFFNFFVK